MKVVLSEYDRMIRDIVEEDLTRKRATAIRRKVRQKPTGKRRKPGKVVTRSFKRFIYSTENNYFSMEITGRGSYVRWMQATMYGEGSPLVVGLNYVADLIERINGREYEDREWLINCGVSMLPDKPGENNPQKRGTVSIVKRTIEGMAVVHVAVA